MIVDRMSNGPEGLGEAAVNPSRRKLQLNIPEAGDYILQVRGRMRRSYEKICS